MIGRLPIRLRLILAFAGVMALVLAATGAFLYLRLAADLDQAIDRRLREDAAGLQALLRESGDDLEEPGESPLTERGGAFAQILTPLGCILDSSPSARGLRLLGAGELARVAAEGELTLDRPPGLGLGEPLRVRAVALRSGPGKLVGAVALSLEERDEALESLVTLLLLGGPVALALAAAAGYAVAAGALRPVEAMRRKAASVSVAEPGERLPVPPTGDEVARLGETLNEMLAHQEAAFERERAFVADASHELRTPLAILKAELELALRAGRSPRELVEALRSAAEETDRLAQLAEDLLVIARSDQGRLPVRLERVEVGQMLSDLRERFRRRFEQQGRELVVEAPEGLALRADRLRLEQALGNLLENALGHGAGTVRLWAARDGEEVGVHVADEGGGFPPDFLPSAFERFSRADQARSRGGAGLGLAIVEAIVRAHGGRTGAGSREGGGADVWLTLPLHASLAAG